MDVATFIKQFEGCKLEAYPDPGTGNEPWTIGYGSTTGVTKGMTITQEEADLRLANDIANVQKRINSFLGENELTPNQMIAFTSFCFNVKSWEIRPLAIYIQNRNYQKALDHWMLYDKANGEILSGLVKRREAEKALFMES